MNQPSSNALRFHVARTAWLDTAVVGGALVILNLIFAPNDPGWTRLNPTPYLVLPVLIGCRYGFLGGILAGSIGAALMVAGALRAQATGLQEVLQAHGYILGSMLLMGGICGEIQHGFRRKELRLDTEVGNLRDRLKKLDTDLYLLREAKAELERLLATKDSELSTLDGEIRRLFESEGEELYQNMLLLLSRQVRITEAALYACPDSGLLVRKGLLGSDRLLPEQLSPDAIEMVAIALKRKTPVTIPDFWQRAEGENKQYLLVLPLLDTRGNAWGVLVVTSMPFMALNKKSVQLISLICRWAGRVVEMRERSRGAFRIVNGSETQKMFGLEFFKESLELAHTSYRMHSLPSTVAIFSLRPEFQDLQPELERAVLSTVRGGDFPAVLDWHVPNVAILLPLSGERGASIFNERIMLHCGKDSALKGKVQSRLISFKSDQSFADLWQEITTDRPSDVEKDVIAV